MATDVCVYVFVRRGSVGVSSQSAPVYADATGDPTESQLAANNSSADPPEQSTTTPSQYFICLLLLLLLLLLMTFVRRQTQQLCQSQCCTLCRLCLQCFDAVVWVAWRPTTILYASVLSVVAVAVEVTVGCCSCYSTRCMVFVDGCSTVVWHTHTHTIVLLLFWNLSGTTQVSRHQKGKNQEGKTNLNLLEQDIVSGSGICWAICKSAPHPR